MKNTNPRQPTQQEIDELRQLQERVYDELLTYDATREEFHEELDDLVSNAQMSVFDPDDVYKYKTMMVIWKEIHTYAVYIWDEGMLKAVQQNQSFIEMFIDPDDDWVLA